MRYNAYVMYVVVGLGNTGDEYSKTRHNAGRRAVLVWVSSQQGLFHFDTYTHASVWMGDVKSQRVRAVLPETYMNVSGPVVGRLCDTTTDTLVVVHDDIDLPLGTVRLSYDRGHGGHNGVRSIIESVGDTAFVRVRIGITPVHEGVMRKPQSGDAVSDFVLGKHTASEERVLEEVFVRTASILDDIVSYGYEKAMNVWNTTA